MTEIPKEYAEALFLLAKESGTEKQTLRDLELIQSILQDNPTYLQLLVSPAIPMRERSQALEQVLTGAVQDTVICFARLFCERGHMQSFDSCLEEFRNLCELSQQVSTAYVTSVVPLTEAEQKTLVTKLETMSSHSVRLECSLDPSILGGVIVRMDGSILDGSLKRRLSEMKEVMEQ